MLIWCAGDLIKRPADEHTHTAETTETIAVIR